MTSRAPKPESHPAGAWEQHEIDQLRRLARLPLPEKLRWLEETQRIVGHMRRAREDARRDRRR